MPFADLPNSLTHPCARIISKEAFEDYDSIDILGNKEFGSGPFKLEEFEAGDHVIVKRFDDYFKEDLPYLDSIEARVLPEAESEITALKNKNIDLMWEVPASQYGRVSSLSGITVPRVPGGTQSNVIMPSNEPPFDDNRVREALKYTLDRKLMLVAVMEGLGVIGNDHPLSPAYRFYKDLPERGRDIDKAKELLKKAGYSSGLEHTLQVPNQPPLRRKIAVVLEEMAKPAGFDINIEMINYDRFLSQVWNKGGSYVGFYTTRPMADTILMKLYHPKYGIDEGRWGESHPEALKLLEDARKTTDYDKRQKLYGEFQEISQNEGPFIIPLFQEEIGAQRDYVKGYKLNPSAFEMELEDTWLTDEAPTKG